MARINLFGASGHAKVIKDILEANGDTAGYIYDDAPRHQAIKGTPVMLATSNNVKSPLIISIGSNRIRKEISERYPLKYTQAIHPQSIVSPSATLGHGTVVMPGAIIQSDVEIGQHCIINTGASVDHECKIADYVHISPHSTLCGNVTIGEGTWIGAASTIIQGIKIGKWCVIGAGTVVIHDIPDNTTVVGNPGHNIPQK